MQILGQFTLLVIVCSVLELHERILQGLLGALIMDFVSCLKFMTQGSGFLVFCRFPLVFNLLWLFLMFGMGLKFLQFGLTNKGIMQYLCIVRGKSNDFRGGFCSRHEPNKVFGPKIKSFPSGSLKLLDDCKELLNEGIDDIDDSDEKENECCPEDEEFDIMALRKLVQIERERRKAACQELEKERIASASAADEAMAMILRLQSEKSSLEIDANQYKRMAEQRQDYDQQVIETLQWIVMKHESERSLLENHLHLCKQKLKLYLKEDELNQLEIDAGFSFLHSVQEEGMENKSISSQETET